MVTTTSVAAHGPARWRLRTVTGLTAGSLALAGLAGGTPEAAQAAPVQSQLAAAPTRTPSVVNAQPVTAVPTWQAGFNVWYGAGTDAPKYKNTIARWSYYCVGETTNFKIANASINMWSNGKRIKGFHFKYRLVDSGTAGRPQWFSNWSKNVTTSFKQGSRVNHPMNAAGLGQSFSSAASWDMEIKLKYPRSKRKAYREKYRVRISTPQCGVLAS
jgi:hypothetical protein